MASLRSITLQSPGTLGLNTQDQDDVQDPRYALQADNCVIAKNGLLQSRKGFGKINAAAATGTPELDAVFSYVEDDGTEHIISTGGNKIWVGKASLVDETGALTVTDDNWQFQNYQGEVVGYNGTNPPIYWDAVLADFAALSAHAVWTVGGLVNSKCHLSAYGRSWVVDTTSPSVINYSDLLGPASFSAGSAGTIDLNTVWPYSNDTITCLAAHNNNLIIFCQKSIVIYGNANDINNLFLVEVIKDTGCIARDSVQNIGDDIFFLSKDGVRSLARTILQDNMPQKEISDGIRDDILISIAAETPGLIRSTYNEKQGFYLINFPSVPETWVCDVRKAEQGIFRWTRWDTQLYGLATGADNTLYGGLAGGWLSEYDGYNDTDTSDGSEDKPYVMKFRTAWFDPGAEEHKLVWKNMRWYTALGTTFTMVMTWAYDFLTNERSYSTSAAVVAGSTYGAGVYGTTVYGGVTSRELIKIPMKGTGSIIKIGFQASINGAVAGFNKVALFFKPGHKR